MITDIHFHIAAAETELPHFFVSEEQQQTFVYKALRDFLFLQKGKVDNQAALEWTMDVLHESSLVQRVVALALDWAYDENGQPDKSRTHMMVSNEFVRDLAYNNKGRVLFGASVNPHRQDSITVLNQMKDAGAVLIKLLPSAQNIDLTDPNHTDFFKEMATLDLPLLCHVGVEHTVLPKANDLLSQRLNDPKRLEALLRLNVKVIAAHCALPAFKHDLSILPDSYEDLHRLHLKYPDLLYADLAAFFIPFSSLRPKGAVQVKRDFPMQCLVFGSDFPMLPFPLLGGHATHMDLDDILKVAWTSNPLDRNVHALQALEYDDCVFSNFDKLLKVP
jgi:uncharacterized protein